MTKLKKLKKKLSNKIKKPITEKLLQRQQKVVEEQRLDKLHLQGTIRFLQEKVNEDEYNQSQRTIKFQQKIIDENKVGIKTLIDKYEDIREELEKQIEELEKANTQLALNVDELKTRLFGRFEKKLKDFALRPDKKKDN